MSTRTGERSASIDSPSSYINRELSWLAFARRVLALAEDPAEPLLERVKFAGIMGMIYDEFAMKRIGGLRRQLERGKSTPGPDGMTPAEELSACRAELFAQARLISRLVERELRPALAAEGLPIRDVLDLDEAARDRLRAVFRDTIEPILPPLAVDAAHPFPFISNLGLNIAVRVREGSRPRSRFVRIKVPPNRPRWVPLPGGKGFVPLEQVIALNLSDMFPDADEIEHSFFRVTRGAKDDPWSHVETEEERDFSPGALLGMVTAELTARKYAG
ncbi:MAG: RNA degradosome polyphosphate kinase, partial [Actinobacteria bacterium]